MSTQQATQTFDGEALTEIHRSLAGKLRAHHISQSFIDRFGEDAVQKGIVEYLRAEEGGLEVHEPRAFVVQAAFRRAIDELRREARRADGEALDRALETGRETSPAAEEEALDNLDASRIQEAIEQLPGEEREVVSLHFFEELSDKRAGELLFMSERTFRRRRQRTLEDLGRMLGAPAPEPGSHRGLEVGLAAWSSLGGARIISPSGPLDHLVGALGSLARTPGRIADRLRVPGTSIATSEVPEKVGTIAAGPAGKVLGGCAGAAIVCALSGIVGPGLQLDGSAPAGGEHHAVQRDVARSSSRATRPLVVGPLPGPAVHPEPTSTSPVSNPATRHAHRSPHGVGGTTEQHAISATRQQSDEQQVEEQVSGIARAATEAETGSSGSAGESASVQQSSSVTTATESSPGVAAKPSSTPQQSQVESEFDFER